jgi:hypothetical protein
MWPRRATAITIITISRTIMTMINHHHHHDQRSGIRRRADR